MAKCNITKFNGSASSVVTPFLGQITINLCSNGTASNRAVYVVAKAGRSIKYRASGVDSLSINNASASLIGTISTGTFSYTGEGVLILCSKYDDIARISLGVAPAFANPSEIYSAYTDTVLQSYSINTVFESVGSNINLKGSGDAKSNINLPLISGFNGYDKISLLDYSRVQVQQPSKNKYGLSGNLEGILSAVNFDKSKLTLMEMYESGVTVSDIAHFADCVNLTTWGTHGQNVGGDIETVFKAFTKLTVFTIKADNVNWNNVFDAWKEGGVVSRSITFYATGTLNGNRITQASGHTVTFDANGDWTAA